MAQDSICGMNVDEQKGIRLEKDGEVYFFCSEHCRTKFLSGTKKAPAAPSAAQGQKTIYTCPMHPEIEQDHPGDCPKCGMTLEPKGVTADDAGEQKETRL